MAGNPFDYVNAINQSKQDIIRDSDNPELAEKDYNSFIINRQMSYFMDTVLFANDMNERHHVPHIFQFDYLINSVRPRKRFTKWAKKGKDEDIEAVREWYQCNNARAEEALSILTPDQLNTIKTKLEKGGVKK